MAVTLHLFSRSLFRGLLLAGLFGYACSCPAWADAPPPPSSLWLTAPDPAPATQKPWILRDRAIALSLQPLRILKDAAARPHPPISIELFNGLRYELDIASTISRSNDSAVIRGLLKQSQQGDFIFYINGNVMAATIHVGKRLFKVEHVSNGRHRLLELNPAKLPPD
ncbi:MAG: hypothetical protein NTX84_12920 [Nitrospirae bacterium]|nr:hypothetical protein [Nitrospirota bacterium]